jgi:NifU-like protein involved in Fe-S cluster formation
MGMTEHFFQFFIAFGLLFALIALWFILYVLLNPQIEAPDGKACLTGKCGDTMEICLKFRDDRVAGASHWTNGCAYSLNCVCAAADLAKGKTPDEILEIDARLIQKSIGGLPSDHLHCARLAEETLQTALEDYMRNRRKAGK